MLGVLVGLNKADMFMVFSSFVCKIHFKEYNTSFNPSAKVVWADLFSAFAPSGTFEDLLGFLLPRAGPLPGLLSTSRKDGRDSEGLSVL